MLFLKFPRSRLTHVETAFCGADAKPSFAEALWSVFLSEWGEGASRLMTWCCCSYSADVRGVCTKDALVFNVSSFEDRC